MYDYNKCMTNTGHRVTGLISAIVLSAAMSNHQLPAVFFCLIGGTAPDWLEIARTDKETGVRTSIIPHRTITHWLPLWLILLAVSIWNMPGFFAAAGVGFAVGGLTHLLFDIPNPMGIPVLNPNKNISLNLWRSGKNEWLLIPAYFLIALVIVLIIWRFR